MQKVFQEAHGAIPMQQVDDAAQKRILNRLRRARGQLDALVNALESGSDCRDVVVQLAAVSKALDRVGYAIISNAMRECMSPNEEAGEPAMTPEELEKLFMMLS